MYPSSITYCWCDCDFTNASQCSHLLKMGIKITTNSLRTGLVSDSQDQKRSVFIPIAEKGNARECSNSGPESAFLLHSGLGCPHVPGQDSTHSTLCSGHSTRIWAWSFNAKLSREGRARGGQSRALHLTHPDQPPRVREDESTHGSVRPRLLSLLWALGKKHCGNNRFQNLRFSCL